MARRHLVLDAPVNFTCPNCGDQFSQTLRQLKGNSHFDCPSGCGQRFDLGNLDPELRGVEYIQQSHDALIRQSTRRK